MSSLFAVARHDPDIYVGAKGQHFTSDEQARRYNAEVAMLKALKRKNDDGPRDITYVRNLTGYTPIADIIALRDMVKAHVEIIKPQFLAIPGKVGWVKEDGRSVRYPIQLPWGDTSDNRKRASLLTLDALLQWMAADVIRPYRGIETAVDTIIRDNGLPARRLSKEGVYALCNVKHLKDRPELANRELTTYSYGRGYKPHMDEVDRHGDPKNGQEERFLKALEVAVKALETPVPPMQR